MSEDNNTGSWLMLGLILALDALIKTPQEEAEAAKKKENNPLKEAEAAGQDVCWDCKTINPDRCSYCQNCMSGCNTGNGTYCSSCIAKNYCGDPNCNGYCYICDDD